jgi:hypothetical protein
VPLTYRAMSLLKPPELPPVQKMPRPRADARQSPVARAVAGVAGIAFGFTALVGVWRAFSDTTGRSSPFMALAMLLPAAMLARYAFTGKIKMQ